GGWRPACRCVAPTWTPIPRRSRPASRGSSSCARRARSAGTPWGAGRRPARSVAWSVFASTSPASRATATPSGRAGLAWGPSRVVPSRPPWEPSSAWPPWPPPPRDPAPPWRSRFATRACRRRSWTVPSTAARHREPRMQLPDDLHYTTEHEWVRLEGHEAVVGITDFAQESLGDVVFVELPTPGTVLKAGQTFGVVESNKSVSDLFAPVSGRVVAGEGAAGTVPGAGERGPCR